MRDMERLEFKIVVMSFGHWTTYSQADFQCTIFKSVTMSSKINWVKMGLYGSCKIQTTYEPL